MKKRNQPLSIKRRFITLIEIMIVMFLIALITGVVAYNYRGTLDEGKAFKTKAGMSRLETVLSMVLADHPDADLSGNNWQEYIRQSKIVTGADNLMRDGWGEYYQLEFDQESHAIKLHSNKYEAYINKNKTSMFK